jgi:hypothetical protein
MSASHLANVAAEAHCGAVGELLQVDFSRGTARISPAAMTAIPSTTGVPSGGLNYVA